MWLNPSGEEMSDDEWGTHFVKTLGVMLAGDAMDVRSWRGEPITDDTFLMLFNASHTPVDFVLPKLAAERWAVVVDTVAEQPFPEPQPEHPAGEVRRLTERSFTLLRRMA